MRRIKGKGIFILILVALGFLGVSFFLGVGRKTTRAALACSAANYTGEFESGINVALFDGNQVDVPKLSQASPPVLGVSADAERYIEVDLSEQKLRAWDGGSLFLESPISSGLSWWPTPVGEFRIWVKLRYTKMEGGEGRNYYYLPNVPFVMYFSNDKVPSWRGYGLHGAYWHNDFGNPRSHGCVNLPIPMAEQLYYWVTPTLPEGKASTFASSQNPGTRIIIHE